MAKVQAAKAKRLAAARAQAEVQGAAAAAAAAPPLLGRLRHAADATSACVSFAAVATSSEKLTEASLPQTSTATRRGSDFLDMVREERASSRQQIERPPRQRKARAGRGDCSTALDRESSVVRESSYDGADRESWLEREPSAGCELSCGTEEGSWLQAMQEVQEAQGSDATTDGLLAGPAQPVAIISVGEVVEARQRHRDAEPHLEEVQTPVEESYDCGDRGDVEAAAAVRRGSRKAALMAKVAASKAKRLATGVATPAAPASPHPSRPSLPPHTTGSGAASSAENEDELGDDELPAEFGPQAPSRLPTHAAARSRDVDDDVEEGELPAEFHHGYQPSTPTPPSPAAPRPNAAASSLASSLAPPSPGARWRSSRAKISVATSVLDQIRPQEAAPPGLTLKQLRAWRASTKLEGTYDLRRAVEEKPMTRI